MKDAPAIEVHATTRHRLGMPPAQFLRDYWQKHPLLIRAAYPGFKPVLGPDELAGLACDDDVLARLIERDRAKDTWTVHHAPLAEAMFAHLPDRDWTLLVQDVDKWDAQVARLLEDFRFLPTWRIDDIMISYAEDGGGVGAHVDQYDVFLLQALGHRRWSIDATPDPPTDFRPDIELKQLRKFTASHAWPLEAGDMLYLPPGVPHDGVAEGKCMTISVGMRAPAASELQLGLAEHLAARLPDSERYADPDLAPAMHAGEIDSQALARVLAALGSIANGMGHHELADWFGRFITRYRCAQSAEPPEHPLQADALQRALARGGRLRRNPWSRMAWIRHRNGCTLYAGGDAYPCPPALAERLCRDPELRFSSAPTTAGCELLATLVNRGHLTLAR